MVDRARTDRPRAETRRHPSKMAWRPMPKGHRILGHRSEIQAGENDLMTLSPFDPACFVEVKAWASTRDGAEAVSPKRRTRIARAASLYLASRPALAKRGARFDIVTVAGLPRHLPDAWRMDG